MSDLSDKKKPVVTESLGEQRRSAHRLNPRSSRSKSGRPSAVRFSPSSSTCGSAGSPGPTSSGYPPGPTEPPTFMKVILFTWTSVDRRRPADCHLVVHHPAVASGAANHPRRHAPGVLRPAVLPGSAAELLQHVEHVQHLDVEPGLVGPGHSGLGVVRETGRHDGRTVPDERAGLLLRPAVHDARLLGHALSQEAVGPISTPSA